VDEDGQAHFFDDIYGYDASMQTVFSKGPPYPIKARAHRSPNQVGRHCLAAELHCCSKKQELNIMATFRRVVATEGQFQIRGVAFGKVSVDD